MSAISVKASIDDGEDEGEKCAVLRMHSWGGSQNAGRARQTPA